MDEEKKATFSEMLKLNSSNVNEIYTMVRELVGNEQSAKSEEVSQINNQLHSGYIILQDMIYTLVTIKDWVKILKEELDF